MQVSLELAQRNYWPLPRAVDENNFFEYATLPIKDILFPRINDSFVAGFLSVVPRRALNGVNMKTLELLLEGNPTTVESMEPKLVVESPAYNAGNAIIKQWLIEIVREELARDPQRDFLGNLLRFWTGSSTVPGTSDLRVVILENQNPASLPVAHTCGLYIEIPRYAQKVDFKTKLLQAVELAGGFLIQ